MGIFPTAEAAFQAYKNLEDSTYITNQLTAKTPQVSVFLGNIIKPKTEWNENKVTILETILHLKFDQHADIRESLLSTGLRPLIDCTKYSLNNDLPVNILGNLLVKIRNKYYENLHNSSF